MILPALCINFSEYMMVCKEKLNKNNLDGAKIVDDGFAIGDKVFCNIVKNGCFTAHPVVLCRM